MDFDTIVIGSGPGGLTAALALARAGEKVLILEQHYLPGGWCHSFTLEGHRFSPGVHYVGEIENGGRLGQVYEGLGVSEDLTMLELNPDGFDHYLIGKERFDVPRGREQYIDRLSARFPYDAQGIRKVFDVVTSMNDYLMKPQLRHGKDIALWGLRSFQSLMDTYLDDPQLKGFLSALAGDHGLPPDMAPAALHGSVLAHYFDGAFYPQGGGAAIPRAYIRQLKKHGAQLKMRTEVAKILVQNGQAIGVRLTSGEEITARNVISNADPHVTYQRLVGDEHLPRYMKWWLKRTRYSAPMLSLFMATDMRLDYMDSGNYWWSKTNDVARSFRDAARGLPLAPGAADMVFVTCTTRKDRAKFHGTHTLEAFTPIAWNEFQKWERSRFGERPNDYTGYKAELTTRMLQSIEHVVPGISQSLTFCELGTPLTNRFYVESSFGNVYGTEKSRWQVGPFAFSTKTPIKNLGLCGASTLAHGILGATMTGLLVAAEQLKTTPEALLSTPGPRLKVLQADSVEPAVEPAVDEAAQLSN